MNPITTGSDNLKFIQLCLQNDVEFLVVGGAAVLHYGCRRREDGVPEIDLMIERSSVNARRVMRALDQAGITIYFPSKNLEKPKQRISIKTNANLDILTPWKDLSYSDLRDRSEPGMIGSEPGMIGSREVRIVSREDLISLKEYAVSRIEAEAAKHRKDLECLKAGSLPST
jgi:hypothetical protein